MAMRNNNPNNTKNLLRRLEEDWDDDTYWEMMRIEDILENRKRLKIIKKYWRDIFEKARMEFEDVMHFGIDEVTATPPKRVPKAQRNWWRNDFVPQKSENVKWLTLVFDSHYDSYCDTSHGTVYIKTKKWYFSMWYRD